MTANETKQLTTLRLQVDDLIEANKAQTEAIKGIQKTLDNLTGGKQALMWAAGIFLSVSGLALAAINLFKRK